LLFARAGVKNLLAYLQKGRRVKIQKTSRGDGWIFSGRVLASACHVGQMKALCGRGLHKSLVYAQGSCSGAFNGEAVSEAQNSEEIPDLLERPFAGWKRVEDQGADEVFGLADLKGRFGGVNAKEFLDHPVKNLLKFSLRERGHVSEIFETIKRTLYGEAFLDGRRLDQFTSDYNPKRALTSCVWLEAAVFNRSEARTELFSVQDFGNNPGAFVPILKAAGSYQPFFPAVRVGKNYYWDARVFDENSPRLLRCDRVFVLLTYPEGYGPARQTERLLNVFGLPKIMGDQIFTDDVRCVELETRKINRLKRTLGEERVVCLYPDMPKTYGPLFFEKGDITKAIQMAEKSAREILISSGL
jgi:hypothetical protein